VTSGEDTGEYATMTSSEVTALEFVGAHPVVRLMGVSAAGRVYECRDGLSPPPEAGRSLVVTVLHPVLAVTPAQRQRLRDDTERLKTIPSPYVARTLELGEHDGAVFIARELVGGEDLQSRLDRDGGIPMKEALRYARDVAKGLRAAAALGVVHGDLRPARLIVDGRRLKVVDFGLLPPVDALAGLVAHSRHAPAAGPAGFIAPEVGRGGPGDLRADLYSLGCTLFALLTGGPPFVEDRHEALVDAHVRAAPPRLSTRLAGVPPSLDALVDALLLKVPAARPSSWDEAIARIEAALDDVVALPSALPESLTSPPTSPTSTTPPTVLPTDKTIVRRVEAPAQSPAAPAPPMTDPFNDPFAAVPSDENVVRGVPTGVVGSLKQMNVVEIVQSLELGRKTAVVEVQPALGPRGTFACQAGRVVHATCGAASGDEAFFALVGVKDGFFRIHYGNDAPPANITAPTQFLVLEALRRIDEAASSPAPPSTSPSPPSMPAPFPLSPPSSPFSMPPSVPARPAMQPAPFMAPGQSTAGMDFDAPTMALPTVDPEHTDPAGRPAPPSPSPPSSSPVSAAPPSSSTRTGGAVGAPGVDDLVADLRELGRGIARGPALLGEAWARAVDRIVGAGTPTRERLREALRRPLALVVIVVVIALGVLVVATSGRAFRLEAALQGIAEGRAAAVLKELDGVPEAARDGGWHLARGHALAALAAPSPPPDEALAAWREAATRKTVDARALEGTLERLVAGSEAALDVLAVWPDDGIIARLRGLLGHEDWLTRQAARRALQERALFSDADADAFGILDLTRGQTCPQRKQGLELLRERGSSAEALRAIEEAGQKRDENACLSREVGPAAKAVAERRRAGGG